MRTTVFEVSVTGSFSAAHQLCRADGSQEPLHWHEWRVSVTCAGDALGEAGMLIDFDTLRRGLQQVLASLADGDLSTRSFFARRDPTAENLALCIAEQLADTLPATASLACVEVEEAPGCAVRYRPPGGRDAGAASA
jgi:6-pyruvoyl tetrahydropterin synthase/QueD family protein